MTDYSKRLTIPLIAPTECNWEFLTGSGLIVARGYTRVVIGKRGPYIEFEDSHIITATVKMPENQKWRLESKYSYVFYDEYRSIDESQVKFYKQRKEVDYADYKINMWYASPFALSTKEQPLLIKAID